ncbi:MAG: PDZ domain-containing protein, partial [Cyclobacteriaceae bacterium]|nr:PDZ domain-containing protein [Cyclobacteriaceae bacterium]
GGIKLREGFYRTVENNIMVNNGFHPHVWFKNSGDVFARNILMTGHQDIRLQAWGKEVDHNLFPSQETLEKAQQNDTDKHSLYGDPLFIDPKYGDFRVLDNSTALKLGFKNFAMDRFGVQKPGLKQIAKTPEIPVIIFSADNENPIKTANWLGATLKNIETMGERSATGLKEISGILILKVKEGSLAAKGGIQEGDVVISCEENEVKTISDLLNCNQGNNWKGVLKIRIVRNQNKEDLLLKLK